MKLLLLLRSLSFEIGRAFLILVFGLLAQFLWLAPLRTRYAFLQNWTALTLWWLKLTCGLSYRVHGKAHIDIQQPSIIMAHHESAWETIAIQRVFPRQNYVLKKEILQIPVFGWTMAMLKPIAIDRKAGRQALKQLIEQGRSQLLGRRDWVVIFPEGTRVPTGTTGKINKGAAMLAKETGVPVYLVAHNAGEFWPKNSLIRKPGVIDMFISPPLDTTNMSVEEINQAALTWYRSHQAPHSTENKVTS